jgi:addiction module RelE/StbE family toxin
MRITFHKKFRKKYAKLQKGECKQCDERLLLFEQDPFHPTLNNHALTGEYLGLRSINITGDLRAHYAEVAEGEVIFVDIDTHSNLYG